MLIYIFKSVACMAVFFAFYKLLLEKENMHVFKRFFLLLAVVSSLLIPQLVFTERVIVEPTPIVMENSVSDYEYIGVPAALEKDVLDIEPLLWTIYVLGFIFFMLKFIKNLGQIVWRIHQNPTQKSSNFVQVLLEENFPPHTFFKYIFLNKKKLEANEIPPEVLLHEETHAKQKHSLDVVLIELFQVLFWFNPFVYLFKRAIKLNHEFLADQAVLKKNIDKTTYQNTLLSYLSQASQNKYQSRMANAINYSSTRLTVLGRTFEFGSAFGQVKKRFTIMKTHTSKRMQFAKIMLFLPLFTLLLFSFSETRYIEIPSENISEVKTEPEQKANAQPFTGDTKKHVVLFIHKNQIVLNNAPVALKVFASTIDELTKNWEETDYTSAKVQVNFSATATSFLEKVETEFQKTHLAKANEKMSIFPDGYQKKVTRQDGASREQMKEYEALAKKYNNMSRSHMRILSREVERLEYIYGIMSDKQKADAEPFPDFPEPPPAPNAPDGPQVTEALELPPPAATSENPPKVRKGEISNIPPPPAPPEPKSPLDFVIEMAKKNAIFYYQNEEISSDRAIQILKENDKINIDARGTKTKRPLIKLSTQPIIIEN